MLSEDAETAPRERDADRLFLWRGTLLNLGGLVVKNVSPVLVIVLARVFSEADFGVFISLHLFVLAASRLTVLGLDRGLVWLVPRNAREGRALHEGVFEAAWTAHAVATAFWVAVSLALALGVLAYLPSLAGVSPVFLSIGLLSLVPHMGLHTFAAALEGARHPEYRVFVNYFVATASGPLISLGLHAAGVGGLALPVGYTLGNFCGAGLLLHYVRRHFPDAQPLTLRLPRRELMRYSLPLGVSEALAAVLLRVDQWMILLLVGPRAAAIYGVMGTLSSGVKSIRQSYDPLIVPIVSRMREVSRGELRDVYSYAVNMVTALQLAVAVVVLFFAKEIMGVAGPEYAVEPHALSLLLAGHLLNGLLSLSSQVVMGLGRSGAILLLNAGALLLNIALNWLFIPALGIAGAAVANAVAYTLQSLVMLEYQRRLIGGHLYARHLWLNFALVGAFCATVVLLQDDILALSLSTRAGVFAVVASCLGGLGWLRRRTFSTGSAAAGAVRSTC
jgi:O-antigen/teichoic acid export membrane protein